MSADTLVGNQVEIRLSDPWDLGEALSWSALRAEVVDVGAVDSLYEKSPRDAMLLRLLVPVVYNDKVLEWFVASPRHEGHVVSDVTQPGGIMCGLAHVENKLLVTPAIQAVPPWRGGVGLIASVELSS